MKQSIKSRIKGLISGRMDWRYRLIRLLANGRGYVINAKMNVGALKKGYHVYDRENPDRSFFLDECLPKEE